MNSKPTLLLLLGVACAALVAIATTLGGGDAGAGSVLERSAQAGAEAPAADMTEPSPAPSDTARAPALAPRALPEYAHGAAQETGPSPALVGAELRVTVSRYKDRKTTLAGFRFDVVLSHNVGMNLWEDEATLAELETGTLGAWEGEIQRPAVLGDRRYLRVRPRQPGFQQRPVVLYHEVRDDPTTPLFASVSARPGSSAAGRLVDAEGRGAPGRVEFSRDAEVAMYASFGRSYGCTAGPSGAFELFLEEKPKFDRGGVIEGVLTARAGGGAAALTGLRWSLSDPPRDLVLTLVGDGSLSGVVRDPAGAPAPALPLIIALDALAQEGRNVAFAGQRTVDRLRGEGLVAVEVLTDAEGAFQARGLCPGLYTVRLKAGSKLMGWNTEESLTPEPVPADGRRVELTYGRRAIRLTLLTPGGEPWRGDIDFARTDERPPWLPHGWPEVPTVLVAATTRRAGRATFDEDPRRWVRGRRLPDGSIAFEAEGTGEFEVRVLGGSDDSGSFADAPRRIEFGPGRYLIDEVVQARVASAPLGTVHVTVTTFEHPDDRHFVLPLVLGEEAPPPVAPARLPFSASAGYRLIVEDAATGAPVAESERWKPVAPWTLSLPPGRYRLRPWRDPYASSRIQGSDVPLVPLGEEWAFDVKAGEQTDVSVESALGARIELTLTAEESAVVSARCKPILIDAGGREWSLLRGEYRRNDIGMSLTSSWPIGETHTSERVTPGRYQLRAIHPNLRHPIDRAVVLEPGETLRVTP